MFSPDDYSDYVDKDGNRIKFIAVNARTLNVSFTGNYNVERDKYDIKQIDIFTRTFSVGDTIKVEIKRIKHLYKVNYIKHFASEGNTHSFNLLVDKQTNSTMFLFPAIADNAYKWMSNHLINVYLHVKPDILRYKNNKHLYLLYRYSGQINFYNFEKMLGEREDVIEIVDIDNMILVVVDLPDRFHSDYDKIMDSKYSEISVELKNRILEYNLCDERSVIGNILNKSETRRKFLEKQYCEKIDHDAELWEAMDMELETYTDDLVSNYEEAIGN